MLDRLTRRGLGKIAAGAGVAASVLPSRTRAAASDKKTLRFIPQTDVQVLDPIWTTAYVTRNHGYMVFDTLFAIDSKFKPHPQMVDGYEVSPDKLNYSFVLRNGLKFHDGQPVRGADCVASLKRWMARDALGQTLATVVAHMTGGDGVRVDRVEWHVVPDVATKTAAMQNGEDDWWENPPADVWPILASKRDITLEPLVPLGGTGCLRFNFLYPPFDNVKMRQAVLMVTSQPDIMTAYVGDPKNWKTCPSFFTC